MINEKVETIDPDSLKNLPIGIDGSLYQWVDLFGEGVPGIFTEQGEGWFYKRNLSPGIGPNQASESKNQVQLAPLEALHKKPNISMAVSHGQFMDLEGDGQPDVVMLGGTNPGFFEVTENEEWAPFRPFLAKLNLSPTDPNIKFLDLNGDGHADALLTEDHVFIWYPSLGEEGFGPPKHVAKSFDEEKGPAIVFADVSQSIYLADMSGDGLTDIVRIRNGEICYWPNLGYGRFGAKVTMDNSPWFDNPDIFDQRRIRVADIDGSGSTDIIYLAAEGLCIYFNQSGNSWSESRDLKNFPLIDNLTSVIPLDLLGNGTACLVWSSPLPNNSGQQMRYIDLMGGQKPHLLIKTTNNLGAETHVKYVSSTHFYVRDKLDGKPWITHLPFPVHVVKQVETFDYISRNHFITRYAYHHGYFDGFEREFRGFGMVEQWDTAELTAFTNNSIFSMAENISPVSQVPPVYTKTWFHTGAYSEQGKISNYFAGEGTEENPGEYYRAGKIDNRNQLLPDTLPLQGLSLEEEREACRALKGMMLRQEIYAQDNSSQEEHPYTVAEQNFTIRCLQPKADKRHGIFFTHPYETLTHHYERNPADPRISHSLKLEVDQYGNILKEVAIAYGRQTSDPSLLSKDQDKQTHPLITYIENKFTNPINEGKDYRTPLPSESQTYELTGYASTGIGGRYQASDFVEPEEDNSSVNNFKKLLHKFDEEINYEDSPTISSQRRLIEHVCTLYRSNDLTRLIPFDNIPPGSITPVTLESMALPGESYKLAFTPGLLSKTYQRSQAGPPTEILLPDLQQVLPVDIPNHQIADRGGYIEGSKIGPNKPGYWYIPTGRVFYSLNEGDSPNEELEYARQHFFMPHRYCDPFGATTIVKYDTPHKLLMVETCDSLGSRTIVGERNSTNKVIYNGNNYRVLQPKLVTDPNRNRTKLAFDALGMMVGTAVQGKDTAKPDNLDNFKEDLTQDEIDRFYNPGEDGLEEDLYALAQDFLQSATNRIIYDINSYYNSQLAQRKDPNLLKERVPVYNATLARETHINDLQPGQSSKIQISFSYSDGFGREIQKKLQAEPEKVNGIKGPLRWVGSGWVIYNNKGKPIQQYEPFFSGLPPGKRHQFEFGVKVGVSPILFYDPLDRVIATLHPNNTYEKVVFTPWWQANYDANDTVAVSDMIGKNSDETGDPRTDPHIQGFVREYFKTQPSPWKTWYQERISGAKGPEEASAANKAAKHANTPTTIHFDTLGRPFLTLIHNGFEENGGPIHYPTRSHLDIEGNQRAVEDVVEHNGAIQERIVMRYAYDMLGTRIYQASTEAGERWMLNDITGMPIRAWNSRNHVFRTEYDMLRRPISSFVTGADPANPRVELLVEHLIYGEKHPETEIRNLRGKPYLHLDQAGLATNEAHDFKGNLLRASRRLAREYKQTRDWRSANAILPPDPSLVESALSSWLEEETFTSHTSYDALNRPTQLIAPHSSQTGQRYNIIQPIYNEANLLEQLDVWLEHSTIPTTLIDAATLAPSPVGVSNIDYDAKGQRIRIDYKNGVSSRYNYDPNTFRLINFYTRRGTVFTEDCENHSPPPPYTAAPDEPPTTPSCGLQNLHYTYDPAGNITHIRDDAQQRIFFRNRIVDPSTDYTYDAVYRLIEATGREHLGQIRAPQPHSYNDEGRIGIDWSANEGNAMGTYIEKYAYDAVGNFLSMNHISTDSSNPGWSRNYHYNEASLLDKTQQINRLSKTKITNPNGTNNILTESYLYDAHGNIVRMPHLANHPDPLAANMHWDYKDQLQQTDLGGGGVSYYVYDASGQRVRKIWEKGPNLTEERIYLGGFEVFRSRNRNKEITLERETLHIMDDKQRIALIETRTQGQDPATQQLIRYQLSNHLGSSVVELNNKAEIISYEEYSPYGSTTYQAVRNQTETPKRYRYTSKEQDEENGFYYHGARYYAAWLGRWTSTDPVSFEVLSFEQASHQPYGYVENKPVVANDPDGRAINFIAAAVGAGVGFVVGVAIEAGRQYVTTGRVNDWGAVGASSVGGAASGAVAGLTMGASLAAQATTAAAAGVVGGITTRALTGQEQTARAVVQDAAIGLLTFGIVKSASAAVSALRGAGTATLESGSQATRSAMQSGARSSAQAATSSATRATTQSSTRIGAASTTRVATVDAVEAARPAAPAAPGTRAATSSGSRTAASETVNAARQTATSTRAAPTSAGNSGSAPPSLAAQQGPAYRIGEGVRRTTIAREVGMQEIEARVLGSGDIATQRIPLNQLFVTPDKSTIMRDPRWLSLLRDISSNGQRAPIEVFPISPSQSQQLIPALQIRLLRFRGP